MTIHDKIWQGVAELVKGHNTKNMTRGNTGQEMIRQALAEIDASRETGQLAELNRAADEMYEIARRWVEDLVIVAPRDEQLAFMRARERHQKALAVLAGGGAK